MGYYYRSNRFNRRRRKSFSFKKAGTLITIVVFLFLIFICTRYFTLFNALRGSDMPTLWRPSSEERIQFLVAGRLDDSIVSCSLLSIPEGQDQPVYILRIPPQTLMSDSESEVTETLASIIHNKGLEAGIQGLNHFLGGKLSVTHYVIYDVEGIAEIIEEIDGVKVDLPAGFHTSCGDSDFVFAPGINRIDAKNLIPFIASDPGLEATCFWAEKSLLVEVFNELFSMRNISYYVTNHRKVAEVYETDMSPRELARFRDTLQALAWDTREYTSLPGRWLTAQGEKYWSSDSLLVDLIVVQILEGLATYDKQELVIDIFNGNGVNGFAAKTASSLQDHQFRIGLITDAERVDSTHIYFQTGYELAAREISLLLGVDAVFIEDAYNNSSQPVAVILGKDLLGR